MIKIKSTLLLIFLATAACSNPISDLENKIEAQAAKNNVDMSYAEIKKTAIYLDTWSKKDFYKDAIDEFKEKDKVTSHPEDLILFTGSSSIRFWGSLEEDMAPHAVLNRGFGGSHIAHVNYHFNEVVKAYEPKAIVFFCGTNDLAALKSPAETFDDFLKFYTMIKEELPGTKLIVIGVKPTIAREYLILEEKTFNGLISNLATEEDLLTYVSVWDPMLTSEGKADPKLFVEDGLHINERGYEIWTRLVRLAIESL
jgi:Lysophospholipase L1 and related esterases